MSRARPFDMALRASRCLAEGLAGSSRARTFGYAAAAVASALLLGCEAVGPEQFRTGVIQANYSPSFQPPGSSVGRAFRVGVAELQDARPDREGNTLWMCALPVLSLGAKWTQEGYLKFNPLHYGGYKKATRDIAELVAKELDRAGLDARYWSEDDGPKGVQFVLRGRIDELTLDWRPHFCGLSAWLGMPVAFFGVPLGNATTSAKLRFMLTPGGSRDVLWEKAYSSSADSVLALYYGNDPMRYGPPSTELFGDVMKSLVSDLGAWAEAHKHDLLRRPPAVASPPRVPAPQVTPVATAAGPTVPGVWWAVVVGISKYEDARIPGLTHARADAKAVHDWLVSRNGGRLSPERVRLLLDAQATGANLREALFVWAKQAIKEDKLLIYFAGHGTPESPDAPENLFLVPYDARSDRIAATGFPMWDIRTALDRFIKARKVVIVADACHAGGVGSEFAKARRGMGGVEPGRISAGLMKLSHVSDGVAVLTASGPNQLSQEGPQWGGGHGVFTHYLLEGLRGSADRGRDGRVSLGELTVYLSEQVRRATRNAQCPEVAGHYDPALVIGQ